jgi:hypothetical protein
MRPGVCRIVTGRLQDAVSGVLQGRPEGQEARIFLRSWHEPQDLGAGSGLAGDSLDLDIRAGEWHGHETS